MMKPAAKRNPWENGSILGSYKVIVEMNPRDISNPHLRITYAQHTFLTLLGYDFSSLPMPLEQVISQANDRVTATSVERAVLKGRTSTLFINLQNRDGDVLSCHITIVGFPVSSRHKDSLHTTTATTTRATAGQKLPQQQQQQKLPPEKAKKRFIMLDKSTSSSTAASVVANPRIAVLTVRSASMVGNTMYIGVGMMSLDNIAPELLSRLIGETGATKSCSSSSGGVNDGLAISGEVETEDAAVEAKVEAQAGEEGEGDPNCCTGEVLKPSHLTASSATATDVVMATNRFEMQKAQFHFEPDSDSEDDDNNTAADVVAAAVAKKTIAPSIHSESDEKKWFEYSKVHSAYVIATVGCSSSSSSGCVFGNGAISHRAAAVEAEAESERDDHSKAGV